MRKETHTKGAVRGVSGTITGSKTVTIGKDGAVVVRGSGTVSNASGKVVRSKPVKGSARTAVQNVIPLGNGWIVKGDRKNVITVVTDNKQQAIEIATSIAKASGGSLKIHNQDGHLVELHTFLNGKTVKKKLITVEK